MIKNIIDLLNGSDWYIGDPDIDFEKRGNSWKETKQIINRRKYGTSTRRSTKA